ncbi:hypothetical protein BKA56DRAFT_611920 [Ilyonectria sp. MPI-CAGE-AT-0026]|nr:hypothetical protein BKA56DRAFT_611920 [Ilyonectria sp. MPI-CAGE-AT-0026]
MYSFLLQSHLYDVGAIVKTQGFKGSLKTRNFSKRLNPELSLRLDGAGAALRLCGSAGWRRDVASNYAFCTMGSIHWRPWQGQHTTALCPPPPQPQEEEEGEEEEGDDDDEMETALSTASLAGATYHCQTGPACQPCPALPDVVCNCNVVCPVCPVCPVCLWAALVLAFSNPSSQRTGELSGLVGLWGLLFDPKKGWLTPCCCCCCRRRRGAPTAEDGGESGTNLQERVRTTSDLVSTARTDSARSASDSVSVPGTTTSTTGTGTDPAPTRSPPSSPSIQLRSSRIRP